MELAPNSDEGPRRLGQAYLNAGKKDEAIAAFTKATEVNPHFWRNFTLLGNAYFELGANDKALAMCRKVTDLEPDLASGWANLGAAYYRLGDFTQSTAAFQKAIDRQPNPVYYSQMGTAYFLAATTRSRCPILKRR